MANKMLIDATHAEEIRVVVVDGNKVEEFDFESENKRQLAGNIYLAKVTRVEPSLQAAFVDYGGNRHGFLAFSEIHPDYYQIPVADREALMEEERAYAEALEAEENAAESSRARRGSRTKSVAEATKSDDAVESTDINGMETIDPSEDDAAEGTSPMERVAETPVEEPLGDQNGDANSVSGAEHGNGSDPVAKDDTIESVADDDDTEDLRPIRKPRPRKYKIQEVVKVRQILLVQVVKEERGNKGAALTTYLSLAGRYCVLMPNSARGGGISRKITNAADRQKLKDIAAEIDVPKGAGLIVRTAGAKRTRTEIKRDYEYLQRLWEQIRELTLKSVAPASIYAEGDLIKRSIRDLYSREIDEVLVEGERGYRIAKDFMKMIMPSHAKNVKHYQDTMPLFARYQVESYLSSMFNPTVQLKSGGYIVIGVTEALVAIDVNSGRATKEGSIEETATKTNLEAAEEIARQLRLRDLAGLIVIDFIDMDDRKNNTAVEKRLKDKLKTDRARIQVGRISGFGLLEMSRQRLRPGMIEATTQPCPACHGTGLIRSDDNMALNILRQIEEEGVRGRSREIVVRVPVNVANFLMNQKREHIARIETRYGLSVRIEGDVQLVSPDFSLEKLKTASRNVEVAADPVVSVDTSLMDQVDAKADDSSTDIGGDGDDDETPANAEGGNGDGKTRRRRRRRPRRSKNGRPDQTGTDDSQQGETGPEPVEGDSKSPEPAAAAATTAGEDEKEDAQPSATQSRAPRRSRSRQPRRTQTDDVTQTQSGDAPTAGDAPEDTPKTVVRTRSRRSAPAAARASDKPAVAVAAAADKTTVAPASDDAAAKSNGPAAETKPEPTPKPVAAVERPSSAPEPTAKPDTERTPKPVEEAVDTAPEDAAKPKRRGWWSLNR
ncbi:Rne/Rng family ribonuclease [Pontibaca salina]|uniref:Ribonuclease E n=1 Tax=Pontibaca salina TaxID=2795731 RepID=A0A934HN34_9RHOB|nr:Rne/Rng family ribonuclease [Pontibaca salina]MBI6628402.1 Rne/Rng family ribonuclease [Pontibaca salina]